MTKILVIDTETGGLDPASHSLLTLGMVAGELETGLVLGQEELLLKSDRYEVTAEALSINQIDLVKHHGTASEAYWFTVRFHSFVRQWVPDGEKMTLLGHNVEFDRGFLKYHVDLDEFCHRRVLDTSVLWQHYRLTRQLDAGGGMSDALAHFGIPCEGWHTALGDARSTWRLFLELKKRLG